MSIFHFARAASDGDAVVDEDEELVNVHRAEDDVVAEEDEMMESEEAGATAGQENQEDPEMKKKKLEAVLGKVNHAFSRFCNTSQY